MSVGIMVVSIFILPLLLHGLVQKYGPFEVPKGVQYESIEVVSSCRSYSIEQVVVVLLELFIAVFYGGIKNLLESEFIVATALISMSLVFLLALIFFALYMRNRVVVFCTDGIVHRTIFGKVHYYPDSSIRGYYYVSNDLCIKTSHGTVALNNSCTNYRIVKTVVGKYSILH